MTITRHHLTRCTALAGVLIAGAGAAAGAASAAQPTIVRVGERIGYVGDPALAVDDVVTFRSAFIGGDHVTVITSDQVMELAPSASSWCSPTTGREIQCATGTEDDVTAQGGPGDDSFAVLPGSAVPLRLTAFGGAGDDGLAGGDRSDSLHGGSGVDRIDGGPGADVAEGDDGDDTLVGDRGSDRLDGGEGHDVADYGGRPDALTIVLTGNPTYEAGGPLDDVDGTGPATARDALAEIEEARGGDGDDHLTTVTFPGTLRGGPGDDLLHGAAGDDVLHGDGGADILAGAGGIDAAYGGDGDDDLRMDDATAEAAVDCGPGVDRRLGDEGDGTAGCEDVVTFGGGVIEPQPELPTPPVEPVAPTPPVQPTPPARPATPARPAGRDARPTLRVRIDARFAPSRRATAVTRLRLAGVPRGATATLTCRATRPAACPFRTAAKRYRTGARRADLLPALDGRRVRAGAVLELRVAKPGFAPTVRRWTMRAGKAPLVTPGR